MSSLNLAAIERSFVALLAGFATMAVSVTLLTTVLNKRLPGFVGEEQHPRRAYIVVNLVYSSAFAAAGGYVTAIVAKADPLRTDLMLAIVVLLISALSALQNHGRQPLFYQFALIILTPVAALAGGLLRMHAAGYRW